MPSIRIGESLVYQSVYYNVYQTSYEYSYSYEYQNRSDRLCLDLRGAPPSLSPPARRASLLPRSAPHLPPRGAGG